MTYVAIQMSSHTASHWEPDTYFEFDVRWRSGPAGVRLHGQPQHRGRSRGVEPRDGTESRRQGVATQLLESMDSEDIFLEVRESNRIARKLYEKLGFVVVGTRPEYYDDPVESALVMRLSRLA